MLMYIIKVIISAVIIVVVSEVAKLNATLGGLIKSLPLISLMAIFWLYFETKDLNKIAELSVSTIIFVLPTFPFFIALPLLLRQGLGFYLSMTLSVAIMLSCYLVTIMILKQYGVKI